jgi:uncharacterized damage-inducible protein DinB
MSDDQARDRRTSVTESKRRKLSLATPQPEIDLWLSALDDTRQRTWDVLKALSDDSIDRSPSERASSIGTLLYHVAIVEADWLFDEILGTIDTDWPRDLFPAEMREDGRTLSPFTGERLADHLDRLKKVRTMLIETIAPMSSEDLHRLRERKHYDVSAAWVLHHLMQHEAEHRSQIGSVREALGAELSPTV